MFTPSRRVADSIKIALAVTLVYAVAYYMDWYKAYWATVSAASVNLLSQGMTLHRGVIRVTTTIFGAIVAMVVIGLFPQERWAYMAAGSIPLFIWGYMAAGEKEDYIWVVQGITFMVIMAVAMYLSQHPDMSASGTVFHISQLRISQTLMGSGIMVLLAVYLWPVSTIGEFEQTARKGLKSQRKLLHLYRRNALRGMDTNQEAKRRRLEDAWLQELGHFQLHLAENDSFEMLETRHQWHHFMHLTAAQIETLEALRESRVQVQGLELKRFLPDLKPFFEEIDQRFRQVDRMLAKKPPKCAPESVPLPVNEAEVQALSRIQQAAVRLTRTQLEKLDEISRSLFECLAGIRMAQDPDKAHDGHHGGHDAHHAEDTRLTIDLDQLGAAFGVVTGVWMAFLIWIYVYDVPNGWLFWAMSGIMAMILAYRGEVPPWDIYWSIAVGGFAAGICYVYIMPHLDGFREYGLMIFITCFVIFYWLHPQVHPIGRMFGVIFFTIILHGENHMHYDLILYIELSLWMFFVVSVAMISRAFFLPQRPDKFFLRLLDRFFRHADWLISEQTRDPARKRGIIDHWKAAIYGGDIAELPRKMALYESFIEYRALPGTTPQQVHELLISVYALAYRVKALVEAGRVAQADLIEEQLLDEKRTWHKELQGWLRRQVGATQATEPPTADLPARLASLEARISKALDQVGEGALEPGDYENFYRLLGSYRSLAEAANDYTRVSDTMDWARWREMRFPVRT